MGLLTKEEYLELREDKFGFISDSEEEEKELKRIDKDLSKYSKSNLAVPMSQNGSRAGP
jgi:hypothetical protein